MADLKPVSPGQRLSIGAGDFNACLDAARAHRARQASRAAESDAVMQAGIVLVQNSSGANRDFLDVLAIDTPIILPTDSLEAWRSRVAFVGVAPGTTHAGRYVVLQEPIASGALGRAMVLGVTPAILDVTAESDRFAEVVSTVATSLKTGTTGSARILWKESGTGSKRGVVMLSGEAPAPKATMHAVYQVAHGASVGSVLRHNGTIWTKSQADTAANAVVGGIVIAVLSPDVFVLATGGYVSGLSGLTAGSVHYLDATTAGALTATAPTIVVPIILADTTTSGVLMSAAGSIQAAFQAAFDGQAAGSGTISAASLPLSIGDSFEIDISITYCSLFGAGAKEAGGSVRWQIVGTVLTASTWSAKAALASTSMSTSDVGLNNYARSNSASASASGGTALTATFTYVCCNGGPPGVYTGTLSLVPSFATPVTSFRFSITMTPLPTTFGTSAIIKRLH